MVELSSSTTTKNSPLWLESLLSENFFNACIIHEDAKKNEKNIFCLECCVSICPHCLTPHGSHKLLQIRRYMYNDVIRLGDAEKLIDCSYVQAYTTNSAKVVFLNPRPQTTSCNKSSNNTCISCDRVLQYPYLFCSISCKINQVMRNEGMMSEYLHECKVLMLEPGLEDGLMTPDSVLEPVFSLRTSSGSSGCGGVDCRTIACTATTEVVRRKRSSKSGNRPETTFPATEISTNRRKGLPRRSPFH